MSKNKDKARDFFLSVKKGEAKPIYYVHGEETYLLDRAVEAIIAKAAPDGLNDFNYDSFQGKSATAEQIRAAAEMLPMMSPRRIVLVRDFQAMNLNELGALEDYFASPSPTTCLIIHARTAEKKIDGRLGIIRKLTKAAEVCEFKALYENEVGSFIQKQAHARNMRLDREAEAYLIEAVGTDLASLDGALEKVDLYVGTAEDGQMRTIGVESVEAIVAQTRVRSVFDLTDALGNRDFGKAMTIIDGMLLAGESPIGIAAMIARHFRIVSRLHDPALRTKNNRELASAVKVNPYFLRDYQSHARKFTLPELRQILSKLLQVDRALKSSSLPDRTVLEGLFFEICFREPTQDAS